MRVYGLDCMHVHDELGAVERVAGAEDTPWEDAVLQELVHGVRVALLRQGGEPLVAQTEIWLEDTAAKGNL